MSLTPIEITEITQRLSEARAALHSLNLGQSAVEIRDSSGEAIRYTPANASRLRAYISELEKTLKGSHPRVVGPMRPTWG